MIPIKITIKSPYGVQDYDLRVPADDTEDDARKITNVLKAAIEMGAALLDAAFSRKGD